MITWGHLGRFVVRSVIGAWAFAALVACQGAPRAAPSPSPVRPTEVSVSPTVSGPPTASGTASAPDDAAWARVPAAARAHTFAGAQAFAEFYLNQVNAAWTQPDPRRLHGLSTERCGTCRKYEEVAETLLESGQRYNGKVVTVRSAAWQPESTLQRVVVYVNLVQEAVVVIDAQGHPVRSERRVLATSSLQVDWLGTVWSVGHVQQVVLR